MRKLTTTIIWGTTCTCGTECAILQEKFHPWVTRDFTATVQCPVCQTIHSIDQRKAAALYNKKIFSQYKNVSGRVLDVGCGSGFLTQYIAQLSQVTEVFAMDSDSRCDDAIAGINEQSPVLVHFIHEDIVNMQKLFSEQSIDTLVSRDLLMFIPDFSHFAAACTSRVNNKLIMIGWYVPTSSRMKNLLHPNEMAKILRAFGWNVHLEFLSWYKAGYCLSAKRIK